MKKLLTAVALASTAFAAHADPSFSLTGVMATETLGVLYSGPNLGSTTATIGNLSVVGGPGLITYQYIGSEASFVNMFAGSGPSLFVTPGSTGGAFVNCSANCTSAAFVVNGTVPFTFTSPLGSSSNGVNSMIEPNFGVILADRNTVAYLLFNDKGAGPDRDYDDMIIKATIAVAPVPEPSTYAMLIAGLGIMGVMLRRRARS